MSWHKLFEQIQDNIEIVISDQPPLGSALLEELIKLHPADIAQLISYFDVEHVTQLFNRFDQPLKLEVLKELSDQLKLACLSSVQESDRSFLLSNLPLADLTDLLDELSDEELNKYLMLLHKRDRDQVLSLLQFDPESAGGLMDTNVLTLEENFTVEKSIQILQRLQPNRDLYQEIFVTDGQNKLVGNIKLEDLVLKGPKTILKSILRTNPAVILVEEDRDEVAQKMTHYSITIAPVVEQNGIFLGIISSETLVEILEEESSEDIYRMATVVPIKGTYFEIPFTKLLWQRGFVLVMLLFVQTISSYVIQYYQELLAGFLLYFLTMLLSTGGNASSQSSAYAIQGMATGEINETTRFRFIRREIIMALILGMLVGTFAFVRIYLTHGYSFKILAVSASLSLIIIVSMALGSCTPLILKRLNIDPAHSAGPLLTTFMDVIGIIIYCFTSQLILGE